VGERNGPFRVLAIDGGGIRGIVPALILAEVERRAGAPIASLFDLVVGTSTGGILAVALTIADAQGRPRFGPLDLVGLYESEASRIFWPWGSSAGWLHALFHPKYRGSGIEAVLQERFGVETRLSASVGPEVAVTSFELDARQLYVFRSWDARRSPSRDFPVWQVARASSAAPTYFPAAQATSVDGSSILHCVDGGVCVDAPVVLALAEARTLLAGQGDRGGDVFLLSVGTGTPPESAVPYERVKDGGVLTWLEHGLLDIILDGVNDAANQEAAAILPQGSYVRLQPPLNGPGYSAGPAMDDCSAANLAQLRRAAEVFIEVEGSALAAVAARLAGVRPA